MLLVSPYGVFLFVLAVLMANVGMQGRIRLQRNESSVSTIASKNWMDKQRKNLQAYEYLCHIGEAKE
jgi:hypothetical protein